MLDRFFFARCTRTCRKRASIIATSNLQHNNFFVNKRTQRKKKSGAFLARCARRAPKLIWRRVVAQDCESDLVFAALALCS